MTLSKIEIILFMVFYIIFTTDCNAQNKSKYVGTYEFGSNDLLIYEDLYILAGLHFLNFGKIEYHDNGARLLPYLANEKFIVYGRINTSLPKGMVFSFENCEDEGVLISIEDKESPNVMQRFENIDANCMSSTNFYVFDTNSSHLYLGNVYSPRIQAFSIPQGFNDFVVYTQNDFVDIPPAEMNLDIDGKSLLVNGFSTTKIKSNEMDRKEMKDYVLEIMEESMSKEPFYYCNAAYSKYRGGNKMIEKIYTEYDNGDPGIYVLKDITEKIDVPDFKERQTYNYHSDTIIFKYQKLESKLLENIEFTTNETPLFTFECNDD